jgi:hypothetical protein
MTDQLKQYFVVGGVYSLETLDRAKELARLAEAEVDDHLSCTLSGMALICAVANLTSVVEQRLVRALASAQAEAGRQPNLFEVRNQLGRGGIGAWLHQLPAAEVGVNVRFAVLKARPARLVRAVRLRNDLVHEEGVLLLNSANNLDSTLSGTKLELRVQIPESPWKSVSRSSGAETVADATDYLEDLDRFREDPFVKESDFFARAVPRGSAG